MNRRLNLEGQKFGEYLVTKYSYSDKFRSCYWECLCSCGNIRYVRTNDLIKGLSKSCGCLKSKLIKERNKILFITHGFSSRDNKISRKFYKAWQGMLDRCLNKHGDFYYRYGGRGITVCDKWRSFGGFKEDMYESYLKHGKEFGFGRSTTLDRIEVNGNYCKENCRWLTQAKQMLNTSVTAIAKDHDSFIKFRLSLERFMLYILFENRNFFKSTISKCVDLTGCTPIELKRYIQSKFIEDMDWNNHGLYSKQSPKVWNIDHIIPVKDFDLSLESERKLCFNYKNLRPLWGKDNNIKRCTVVKELLK
jgi:hypothetical protein